MIDLSDRGAGTGKPPGTDVRRGVTTLPMLYLEQRASSDADAAELLGRLHLGTQGKATEEQFHQAIGDLREHDVTAATMAKARDMADDAIAELSAVPAGIVRDALTRFAHQIVERSY